MAHVPPRRVPRPRFLGGAGAASPNTGSSAVTDHGILTGLTDDDHSQYHTDARGDARYSVLAHTHLEADITDLQTYALLAGAVFTGTVGVSHAAPKFRWDETGVAADNSKWDLVADVEALRWRVNSDDFLTNTEFMKIERTGTTVDSITLTATSLLHGANAIFTVAGGTITGETLFSNAKTRLEQADPSLIWKQTGAAVDEKTWRVTARTNQLRFGTLNDAETVAGNQMVFNRSGTAGAGVYIYGGLRLYNSGETDYGTWSHDGTDFNLVLTNTTDYNITGLARMLINAEANVTTFLELGEGITARGTAQDAKIIMWGEGAASVLTKFIFTASGGNFGLTSSGTGAFQAAVNLEVNAGKYLMVRDSSAADWAKWSHDGTDFNLAFTNTTDYNITGANINLTGNLTVSNNFGVSGATAIGKQTITGSRGGNAALASLLTKLALYGLILDSTTA